MSAWIIFRYRLLNSFQEFLSCRIFNPSWKDYKHYLNIAFSLIIQTTASPIVYDPRTIHKYCLSFFNYIVLYTYLLRVKKIFSRRFIVFPSTRRKERYRYHKTRTATKPFIEIHRSDNPTMERRFKWNPSERLLRSMDDSGAHDLRASRLPDNVRTSLFDVDKSVW